MNDPAVKRLQRAVDDSKRSGGMQAGLPVIKLKRDDAERILLLLESLQRRNDGG